MCIGYILELQLMRIVFIILYRKRIINLLHYVMGDYHMSPRNTREWAKRKIQMSIGNLDTAGGHLEEVKIKYADEHPDIAGMCEQLQLILAQNIVFLERLDEGM